MQRMEGPETEKSKTDSVLICALCMEKFSEKSELREHYNSVHKDLAVGREGVQRRIVRKFNRHLCNSCGKHFGDSWTLNHHQKTVHRSAREHVCGKCGKKFLSNKDVLRHFRGVHLGEKIIFPGGRSRKVAGISINAVKGKDSLDSRLIPNILKKSDKKSLPTPPPSNLQPSGGPDTVIQIIGIEKPGEGSEDNPENYNSMMELGDQVEFLQDGLARENKEEEPPMFQLENLENLQLVVPEDSGEPRIIIPETGIKLTIQSDLGNSERKVLHLIPDISLPVGEEIQNINLPLSPVLNSHNQPQGDLIQLLPVTEEDKAAKDIFKEKSEISEGGPGLDSPKKFVYKKVIENSSSHLVSVSPVEGKLSPTSVDQYKCEKCGKFFISKEFLEKHLLTTHTEIPPYNISIFNSSGPGMEDSQLQNLEDIESIINFSAEDSSLLKAECIDALFNSTEEKVNSVSGFQCKICKEFFESRQQLQRHSKSSHKKQVSHKCGDCGAQFTSSQSLKSHVLTRHEGIKKVCSVCLKPVVDLTRHIRVQHKNAEKRDFHCDVCDSKFR